MYNIFLFWVCPKREKSEYFKTSPQRDFLDYLFYSYTFFLRLIHIVTEDIRNNYNNLRNKCLCGSIHFNIYIYIYIYIYNALEMIFTIKIHWKLFLL